MGISGFFPKELQPYGSLWGCKQPQISIEKKGPSDPRKGRKGCNTGEASITQFTRSREPPILWSLAP